MSARKRTPHRKQLQLAKLVDERGRVTVLDLPAPENEWERVAHQILRALEDHEERCATCGGIANRRECQIADAFYVAAAAFAGVRDRAQLAVEDLFKGIRAAARGLR